MKVTFDKTSYPVFCDTGPHKGSMRVDLLARVYLTADEYARYGGADSLEVTLKEDEPHDSDPATGESYEGTQSNDQQQDTV